MKANAKKGVTQTEQFVEVSIEVPRASKTRT